MAGFSRQHNTARHAGSTHAFHAATVGQIGPNLGNLGLKNIQTKIEM